MLIMNKYAIPTVLTAIVLLAGIFAFNPVEQASTVHNTILAGTGEFQSVSFDGNDCKANGNDGSFTITLDAATDVAIVYGINLSTDEATDGGDFLDFDINTDGLEIVDALLVDGGPIGSTELLSAFDRDGSERTAIDGGIGPVAFHATFVLDVDCTFGNGDLDYDIDIIVFAPAAEDLTATGGPIT